MSMQTWCDEFYPERAQDLAERVRHAPDAEKLALEHSLRKWRGLRPEALARHDVERSCSNNRLQSRNNRAAVLDSFAIGACTCALCVIYCSQPHRDVAPCRACPLARSRGGVPCDELMATEARSPWAAFVAKGDPEPMIAALKHALNAEAPPPRPWAWERAPAEDTEGGAL